MLNVNMFVALMYLRYQKLPLMLTSTSSVLILSSISFNQLISGCVLSRKRFCAVDIFDLFSGTETQCTIKLRVYSHATAPVTL